MGRRLALLQVALAAMLGCGGPPAIPRSPGEAELAVENPLRDVTVRAISPTEPGAPVR
jgi:hypothetical protein